MRSSADLLGRHRMERAQAAALDEALAADPSGRPFPGVTAAKPEPGDLRGIPVIGPGVGGASPGTNPESQIDRIDRDLERRRRALAVADAFEEPMVAYA